MEKKNQKEIMEINAHIKEGLEQWANICLLSDADGWSYYMDYDKEDVFNAALIFQHVCSNIGIKTGRIREKEATEFGNRMRQLIIGMTGIDPAHVSDDESVEENK